MSDSHHDLEIWNELQVPARAIGSVSARVLVATFPDIVRTALKGVKIHCGH